MRIERECRQQRASERTSTVSPLRGQHRPLLGCQVPADVEMSDVARIRGFYGIPDAPILGGICTLLGELPDRSKGGGSKAVRGEIDRRLILCEAEDRAGVGRNDAQIATVGEPKPGN